MLETQVIRNSRLCKLHKVSKGLSADVIEQQPYYFRLACFIFATSLLSQSLAQAISGYENTRIKENFLRVKRLFQLRTAPINISGVLCGANLISALNHRAPNAVILTSISKRNSRFASTPATSGAGNSFRYDATSWRVLFLSAKQTQISTK